MYLINRRGITVVRESWADSRQMTESVDNPGEYEVQLTIPPVLPAGEYLLCVWAGFPIGTSEFETLIDEEILRFEVLPCPEDLHHSVMRERAVQPSVSWRVVAAETLHHASG